MFYIIILEKVKTGIHRFVLKAGKSASDGVDALRSGLTLTGSAEMCLVSYFTALGAELTALNTAETLTEARLARFTAFVDLYITLGGDGLNH